MTRDLSLWEGCAPLSHAPMAGRFAVLEPLSMDHAAGLARAFDDEVAGWQYLAYGPLDVAGWEAFVPWARGLPETLLYAVCDPEGVPKGVAGFLSIRPAHGVAEIGHLNFSAALRRSPAATEALTMMMAHVFASGYRRCEWKCDAQNLGSRRAAQRLGFSHEGVFHKHMVVKERNRDTAWFAVTDGSWPGLSAAFATWLAPDNFGPDGRQVRALSDVTRPHLVTLDPALSAC